MFNSIVEAIFTFAETQPDKLAVADESRKVTYSQYKDEICRFARILSDMGIKKDDKVVVEAPQAIELLSLAFAIHLVGGVFVPLERNCAWEKIVRIYRLSDAVLAVTIKEHEENDGVKPITLSELKEKADSAEPLKDYTYPDGNAPADILLSTGTTFK